MFFLICGDDIGTSAKASHCRSDFALPHESAANLRFHPTDKPEPVYQRATFHLGVVDNLLEFLIQKLESLGPIDTGGDVRKAEFEKGAEELFQRLLPCAIKIGRGHFYRR